MDLRFRKLKLGLTIMSLGMLLALLWHGYQGWILGRGYPYNTFFFCLQGSFSDFDCVIFGAAQTDPYAIPIMAYFPATYLFFKSLIFFNLNFSDSLFVGLGIGATVWLLRKSFLQILPKPALALNLALIFFAASYPILFSLNRGNIEVLMALLTAQALFYFQERRFWMGLGFLFPAICFKLYPILLVALFLRPRHYGKIGGMILGFLGASFGALLLFQGSVISNLALLNHNIAMTNEVYVIHNAGFAGTSTWNMVKAILSFAYYFKEFPADVVVIPVEKIRFAFALYSFISSGGVLLIAGYAIFFEKEFFRRTLLLLLLLSSLVPNGGDYRLLYVTLALVVMILLPTFQRYDFWIVGLLAFVNVPKREIIFPFLGPSDTGMADISMGILLNPACILTALVLMMKQGMEPKQIGHRIQQKTSGIMRTLWRDLRWYRKALPPQREV